ncbi:MAG: hypothetical protein EOO77_33585 [Oxalobacteraceae bacterium]|nr:MAG: hypothetical protein EOO77_33585 [Oxalobacteraceae bacterium]
MDIPAYYHTVILWIGDGTGLPDEILHIHAGGKTPLRLNFQPAAVNRSRYQTPHVYGHTENRSGPREQRSDKAAALEEASRLPV